MGKGQRTDDDDKKHHKERGHADLVELLNTAGYTALHDNHADHDEKDGKDNASQRSRQHGAEDLTAGHGNRIVTETELGHVQRDVLQAVAAEHGVEAHDQERGDGSQPADPGKLLCYLLIGVNGAELGLAADSQLGDHDDHADKDRQQQVDNQKHEAAGFAHLVGEAPDVAETDSRTDGSKQEAYVAAPGTAIVLHYNSPLSHRKKLKSQPASEARRSPVSMRHSTGRPDILDQSN